MMMMMCHNSSGGGGVGCHALPGPALPLPCPARATVLTPGSPLLTNVNARDTKNMYTVPLTQPPRGAHTRRGAPAAGTPQSSLSPAAATLPHSGTLGAGLLVAQGIRDTTLTLLYRYTLKGNTEHIRTLLDAG